MPEDLIALDPRGDRPFPLDRHASLAIDSTLRAAILACDRPTSTIQDQKDCASFALALGHPAIAKLLYEAAFLRDGFAAAARRAQDDIASATGLWTDWPDVPDADEETAASGLDTAIVELRALFAHDVGRWPPARADYAPGTGSGAPSMPRRRRAAAAAIDVDDIIDMAACLLRDLRIGDAATLEPVLKRLGDAFLTQPPYQDYLSTAGSLLDVAAIVVRNQLRAFVARTGHLGWAPLGSAALLVAVSRLPQGGLGPYLSGVGRLLLGPKSLFGLIEIAARPDGMDPGGLQRWLILLASHLDRWRLDDLVNEIADRGLVGALEGILIATRRLGDVDRGMLWTLRDAALDIQAVALAAEAQRGAVELAPADPWEWVVLAEILDTAGARTAARHTLRVARMLRPAEAGIAERAAALAGGVFERYHTLYGFGSSPWRVAMRAAHRLGTASDVGGSEAGRA